MSDQHLDSRYVESQFETMHTVMDKFYEKLEHVAGMATQIAVITDRQAQHALAIERCAEMIRLLDERMEADIKHVEESNSETRKEVDKWVNRGMGAWAVAIILVTVIQYFVMHQIQDYTNHNNMIDQAVTSIDRRLSKVEASQVIQSQKTDGK